MAYADCHYLRQADPKQALRLKVAELLLAAPAASLEYAMAAVMKDCSRRHHSDKRLLGPKVPSISSSDGEIGGVSPSRGNLLCNDCSSFGRMSPPQTGRRSLLR